MEIRDLGKDSYNLGELKLYDVKFSINPYIIIKKPLSIRLVVRKASVGTKTCPDGSWTEQTTRFRRPIEVFYTYLPCSNKRGG